MHTIMPPKTQPESDDEFEIEIQRRLLAAKSKATAARRRRKPAEPDVEEEEAPKPKRKSRAKPKAVVPDDQEVEEPEIEPPTDRQDNIARPDTVSHSDAVSRSEAAVTLPTIVEPESSSSFDAAKELAALRKEMLAMAAPPPKPAPKRKSKASAEPETGEQPVAKPRKPRAKRVQPPPEMEAEYVRQPSLSDALFDR